MTKEREDLFMSFVSRALGTPSECPLKDVNGTAIKALVEAFDTLHAIKKDDQAPSVVLEKGPTKPEVQDFQDAIYEEPWTVYVIRNTVSGVCYVGVASKGFKRRYRGGEWWAEHHNDRLSRDVVAFGLMSFRVLVHVCLDETDMRRQEAELLRANRLYTYNVRNEPDNR